MGRCAALRLAPHSFDVRFMKSIYSTSLIWLILAYLVLEINILAYNYVYYPLIDPETNIIQYGSPLPDMLLLTIYAVTFAVSGAVISWKMNGNVVSLVSAIAFGSFCLALELSLAYSLPWFLLMPAHPAKYDHFLAFFASITPPLFAFLGAYLYNHNVSARSDSKTT